MKGVILAGGTGSRLRPITNTSPKALVPIANKALIEYALEDFAAAGITDVAVVLGKKGEKRIQQHLADRQDLGVDITYVVQGEPLGLAHAVGCTEEFVGDKPFVVYLADVLVEAGIESLLVDFDPAECAAALRLQAVDDPSRYGIATVDEEGRITDLVEKPEDPPSDLAVIGTYAFTPAIFDQIQRVKASWRDEYEITSAIRGLLEDGYRIQSQVVDGWWRDTGTPSDIVDANQLILDDLGRDVRGTVEDGATVVGRVELGENSVVREGASIHGPTVIGSDTTITGDGRVGPYTSIGDDCVVSRGSIASSVILDGARIDCDRRLVNGLVGREADLGSNDAKNRDGDRLVVGRNATLEL